MVMVMIVRQITFTVSSQLYNLLQFDENLSNMSFASVNDITAKLEKLEQNITLTLQEIDHNFSACQYKVTTKILPQITRFACVSEDIWENSKVSFQLYYIYIYFFFFQRKRVQ